MIQLFSRYIRGADKSLASHFTYFYVNNTFIASKFIVLYMSDLNFIIVARLFIVCCRYLK
jgi:hypothetical protein